MSLKSEIIALAIEHEERLSLLEITDAITEACDHIEARAERQERGA